MVLCSINKELAHKHESMQNHKIVAVLADTTKRGQRGEEGVLAARDMYVRSEKAPGGSHSQDACIDCLSQQLVYVKNMCCAIFTALNHTLIHTALRVVTHYCSACTNTTPDVLHGLSS